MSLSIAASRIDAVLLTNGDWFDINPGSFYLDSYEYVEEQDDDDTLHGGGNSGVCATGFVFTTKEGELIAGPLTAIVAVRR